MGILIAFSLDDWNEDRKAQNTELILLNELISGLTTDLGTINFNIDQHNQAIESCEIVLKAINEHEEYYDSLAFHSQQLITIQYLAVPVGPMNL